MAVDICSPSVGQYHGVFADEKHHVSLGSDAITLRILGYRSMDVFGLYGSEYNGIAILDDTNKSVVTDNVMCCQSGYDVNEDKIKAEIKRLKTLSNDELRDYIIATPRFRG